MKIQGKQGKKKASSCLKMKARNL